MDLSGYKMIKFISNCEYRIEKESQSVILWIPFYKLSEFTNILGYDYFSEGGEDVNLQHNCIALEIQDLMEWFEIYHSDLVDLLD